MKKILSILAAGMLIASLSACAGPTSSSGVKVKCPACGYEFSPDAGEYK